MGRSGRKAEKERPVEIRTLDRRCDPNNWRNLKKTLSFKKYPMSVLVNT